MLNLGTEEVNTSILLGRKLRNSNKRQKNITKTSQDRNTVQLRRRWEVLQKHENSIMGRFDSLPQISNARQSFKPYSDQSQSIIGYRLNHRFEDTNNQSQLELGDDATNNAVTSRIIRYQEESDFLNLQTSHLDSQPQALFFDTGENDRNKQDKLDIDEDIADGQQDLESILQQAKHDGYIWASKLINNTKPSVMSLEGSLVNSPTAKHRPRLRLPAISHSFGDKGGVIRRNYNISMTSKVQDTEFHRPKKSIITMPSSLLQQLGFSKKAIQNRKVSPPKMQSAKPLLRLQASPLSFQPDNPNTRQPSSKNWPSSNQSSKPKIQLNIGHLILQDQINRKKRDNQSQT